MSFAFFDVCSHHPRGDNIGFVLAGRLVPAAHGVARTLDAARRLDAPVVSTSCQCIGVQRAFPAMSPGAAVSASNALLDDGGDGGSDRASIGWVSMRAAPDDVSAALRHRRIVIERRACASSEETLRERIFDVFHVNPHAADVIRRLGKRHWLVFGNSLEYCLSAVVEGLRRLGAGVTVLDGGCVGSGRSTDESFQLAIDRLGAIGATWARLDDVLGSRPLPPGVGTKRRGGAGERSEHDPGR